MLTGMGFPPPPGAAADPPPADVASKLDEILRRLETLEQRLPG